MSKHPKQRAVDGNTKQVENEESKYLSNLKPFKFTNGTVWKFSKETEKERNVRL